MKHAVFVALIDGCRSRVFDDLRCARDYVYSRIGWDLAEFGSARMCQLDDDADLQCFYACVYLPGGIREYSIHPEVLP